MHRFRFAAACAASVVIATTLTTAAMAAAPPAPSNDLGGHAIAITPKDHEDLSTLGPVASFDSTSATLQNPEPQPSGTGCGPVTHTAWYSLTMSSPTLVHLSAGADAATPEIAVYTGAIPSTLVTCNYTGNAQTEESYASVDISATAGTKYWIQVGTATTTTGVIYLNAYYVNAPTTDTIASSLPLTNLQLQSGQTLDSDSATFANRLRADATLATVQTNEPVPTMGGCVAFARTRWYRWTAPSARLFDATPLGGSKVQLAVWTGSTPSDTSPTAEVGCVTADSNTAARFNAIGGATYWFQLGSAAASGWDPAGALFFWHITPPNDASTSPQQLSFAPIATTDGQVIPFDNTLAPAQPGEPQPTSCSSAVNHSTWYKLSNPDDIVLTAGIFITSTGGARKGNDVIALYTATAGDSGPGSMVSCNSYDGSGDDPSSFMGINSVTDGAVISTRINANTIYYLQVAGNGAQAATGDLYLQATHLKPALAQVNKKGVVTLGFFTDTVFHGKTVYFYRRSGMTGQVVPLGTGTVDSSGIARRTFNAKPGQILALYGKIMGVTDIYSPYSNSVTFKVS